MTMGQLHHCLELYVITPAIIFFPSVVQIQTHQLLQSSIWH